MNQAIILGRIGKDPETKQIGSTQMTSLSVATGTKWTDKDGNKQERTEWHNVVAWGKQAETIQKFFKIGDQILVQGEIQYQTWDKDDGTKGYKTVIKLEKFNFVGGKRIEVAEEPAFEPEVVERPNVKNHAPQMNTGEELPF